MEENDSIKAFYAIFFQRGVRYIHNGYGYPVDEKTIDYIDSMLIKTRALLADKPALDAIILKADAEQKEIDESCVRDAKETKQSSKGTFVYLVKDRPRGLFKIGYSNDVRARLKQLRTSNAGIEYWAHFEGTLEDEKFLHDQFTKSGKHVDLEWFALDHIDIEFIQNYFNQKRA